MEIEVMKCECCGLKEECTPDYILEVKSEFEGKWLCGLCSEAVRDEVVVSSKKEKKILVENSNHKVNEAVKAHMSFCREYQNPAIQVADGMRKMLIRRRVASDHPSSSSHRCQRFPRNIIQDHPKCHDTLLN